MAREKTLQAAHDTAQHEDVESYVEVNCVVCCSDGYAAPGRPQIVETACIKVPWRTWQRHPQTVLRRWALCPEHLDDKASRLDGQQLFLIRQSYLERRFCSAAVRTVGSLSFITNTGGMKAVVWTDVFQMSVMVLGLAFVVVLGVMKVGSPEKVWTTAKEGGRIQFLNTQVDTQSSVSLWNVLLGTTFIWLASYGTSQTQVQRFCSVSTLREAKTLGCVAGLVIYANYPNCDPLKSGKISKQDQLIPFFVMETLSVVPGLPGLFVACVFSGALSTLSSGFNSLAAVTWEDFIKKWWHASEKKAAYVTKAVASAYGLLTIGLAFLAGSIGSILKAAFAMSGALSGPLLGVFLLGMVLPSCNGKVSAELVVSVCEA
ncbi:hypothetical protein HPB51_018052 [Rhipicephalus microplus]|uniref:Sodium/solute symporter n=1 Tax=Rhipicephalus microplus TaxID=6941 RepID=A0A9J6DPJ0_RHIMP|nr:hypothetical protein HPB51_018052 [Rhipicephalus microplus]